MAQPLVECIPNFSEARRPEVVQAIVDAIQSVPGVVILDKHSDLDHNRTVVTLVGAPAPLEESMFLAIQKAAQLIDLDYHTGEHPRLGATDVVPFVPIQDVTLEACVEMARRLGKRVGEELQIPVYLYEEAAARPERKNLEDIRRGEYETLKTELGVKPARDPDFGPARISPAGGTVIGARHPLIAFNLYLTTSDVAIAQKIAKAVRHSSGGLRYVKALGLMVEGRAQVSMNLTNFRQTPIARVVELVRREAERYGVGIHHAELVGLIPQEALVDAAVWYTQLDAFSPEQILEKRMSAALAATPSAAVTVEETFIDQVAQGTPAPGGGSAAAHTGALAAALAAMVARLTIGKKKYAAVEAEMWELIDQAEALRAQLLRAVDEDAAAFAAYMASTKLPKDTPEQQTRREEAMLEATLGAIRVPEQVAGLSVAVMQACLVAAEKGNLNAISDAASGAALARAALTSAGLNVRINSLNLAQTDLKEKHLTQLRALEEQAKNIEARLQAALVERGQIPF